MKGQTYHWLHQLVEKFKSRLQRWTHERSAIEICVQGMNWGLQCILKGIQPRTSKELATRAHDMELSLKAHGDQSIQVLDPHKKEKQDIKKGNKYLQRQEIRSPMRRLSHLLSSLQKWAKSYWESRHHARWWKEKGNLQREARKVYPFSRFFCSKIFYEILKTGMIELPEMKHSKEARRTMDPNYCKYQCLLGYPIEKIFHSQG